MLQYNGTFNDTQKHSASEKRNVFFEVKKSIVSEHRNNFVNDTYFASTCILNYSCEIYGACKHAANDTEKIHIDYIIMC